MAPLASVVVPVWNVAALLPRCLDSLLAQAHRPLEIIVVDDGSVDGSGEVMRRYHEQHDDVEHVQRRKAHDPALHEFRMARPSPDVTRSRRGCGRRRPGARRRSP